MKSDLFQVPKKWIYGDCGVDIDLKKGARAEIATFRLIGEIAIRLAEYCVKDKPPHLGGLAEIGEDENLELRVFNWRPPRNISIS